MKKLALIILLLAVSVTSFARHKHKKKKGGTNEIESVSMHRTGCFGRCPIYTVEINENGIATYTAKMFNADTGTFQKNIGTTKAMEVINQFAAYRVDTCKDDYKTRAQDIPSIIYTIKYRDSTKTISNANFGPYFLRTQLSGLMDNTAKKTDDSWKKVEDTAKPK